MLAGANVNAASKSGQTPLHLAAERGSHELCSILIESGGANPNLQDLDGNTPLHLAVRSRQVYTIRRLIGEEFRSVLCCLYRTFLKHLVIHNQVSVSKHFGVLCEFLVNFKFIFSIQTLILHNVTYLWKQIFLSKIFSNSSYET